LAKQIQQQILALGCGSGWKITVSLIVGGEDMTRQGLELGKQPNFVVGTPGRVAELCRGGSGGDGNGSSGNGRGMYKPNFTKVKFVVLDEADRLLCPRSGFERDVAEILLQSTTTTTIASTTTDIATGEKQPTTERRIRRDLCRTLLFSATLTRSLKSLEEMAGAGMGRLPLTKVVIREDGSSWETEEKDDAGKGDRKDKKRKVGSEDDVASNGANDSDDENSDCDASEESDHGSTPNIPAGLRQEYIFMPSRVREAYLLCAIRTLMTNGGRGKKVNSNSNGSGWNNNTNSRNVNVAAIMDGGDDNDDVDIRNDDTTTGKKSRYPLAQSAIIFVPTCERCAHISGILTELGIHNVALHSLLSQNRRLASLGTFQSQRVRVLVATDVASRGLDIPEVDLVINAELPRRAVDYVHRVGRTARAGRRGRAVSLVGEQDVDLVHEAERITGRSLEKCEEITDDMAVRLLGPVAKASRLTKMKLMDIGFDELVAKHRERKRRDRRRREKAERAARKASAKVNGR
jgi:superfamily II DNA/RNA helicase